MMRFLTVIGLVVVASTTAALPIAQSMRTGVDAAAIAAADADYAEALATADRDPDAARERFLACAEAFAKADPGRRSAGALYNEANALFRAGKLADAIATYRSALVRDPANARILANLAEARSQVARSPGPPAPTPLNRVRSLWSGVSELARWSAVVALLWAALALSMAARRRHAAIAIALAAAVGSTVLLDVLARTRAADAVIAASSTLRKGNGDGFEPMLADPLPTGTECRVLDARPGWLEVEIAGQTKGWIRDDAVVRIR